MFKNLINVLFIVIFPKMIVCPIKTPMIAIPINSALYSLNNINGLVLIIDLLIIAMSYI